MKDLPLVSIVTVTRNRANLIGRCISSIQGQTYQMFEHIIVDGNSSDNTEDVVRSFSNERIKYFKMTEEKSSHKDSFDFAFQQAQGKYITFLDDDDEYLPEKIEKQVRLFESLPDDYGLVYCWMTYYDSVSNKIIRKHQPAVRGDVKELVVEKPVVSGTPTFLIKRELFMSMGGWVSTELTGIGSDWAFGAKFCQLYKVDFVPESLINVYVNHSGATRMSDSGYYRDMDLKLIKFHNYFLTTYAHIFSKYPRKAINHYLGLSSSYFHIHNFRKGFEFYRKLLKLSPSLNQLLLPLKKILW